ncbi:MAG: N-6 DNA methylase, partial [Planctomycetaceae bacterium]
MRKSDSVPDATPTTRDILRFPMGDGRQDIIFRFKQLSSSDIADLAGVSPSAVSNWRKRYVDFPEPIDSAGRWARFDGGEVRAWLVANDKLPVAAGPSTELTSIEDVLLEVVNRTRVTLDPLESLAVAGAFAATLVEPEPNWEDEHEEVLADLSDLIGKELPALHIAAEELYSNLILANQEDGYQEIADAVLKVADRIGTSTRNNEGTTSSEVADFIAAAVAPSLGKHIDPDLSPADWEAWENHYWVARSFYDPCAGVGRTLLRAAQEHDDGDWPIHVSFFGQEINPHAARVASLVNRLNLAPFGDGSTDIVVGDSLQQDHFPDRKADLVVAHPPFGLRLPDGLGDDSRWILGNPGRDGSSAWIQIALSKLSERGRAAVVVEPSWAFRGGP